MTKSNDELTGADAKHGYRFGCDGVVDLATACDLLGLSSKSTVTEYGKRGFIRIGKHKAGPSAKSAVCRRSIAEYLATLEN